MVAQPGAHTTACSGRAPARSAARKWSQRSSHAGGARATSSRVTAGHGSAGLDHRRRWAPHVDDCTLVDPALEEGAHARRAERMAAAGAWDAARLEADQAARRGWARRRPLERPSAKQGVHSVRRAVIIATREGAVAVFHRSRRRRRRGGGGAHAITAAPRRGRRGARRTPCRRGGRRRCRGAAPCCDHG